MDVTESYELTRRRLLDVAAGLDDREAGRDVPALPGWTVKDTYAHLTGVCADVLAGRMDGAPSDEWTARQVAERADRSLAEVCAEWDAAAPHFDAWLRDTGDRQTSFAAFDCWAHEQDVLGALGRKGERDDPRVRYLVGRAAEILRGRIGKSGAPPVRIIATTVDEHVGDGEPAATLRTDDYELLRIFMGRRSRAQLEAAGWEGDPAPYVDHMHLFELPRVDLLD
jgi:uncharacterized protein (TIGR03083 family)